MIAAEIAALAEAVTKRGGKKDIIIIPTAAFFQKTVAVACFIAV